jgi:hypothetical protein
MCWPKMDSAANAFSSRSELGALPVSQRSEDPIIDNGFHDREGVSNVVEGLCWAYRNLFEGDGAR